MGKRYICPRGHAWEAEDAVAPADCPVCHAPGIGSEDATVNVPRFPGETPTLGPSSLADAVPALPSGYEILGELGRGGMGVVLKAREVALGRVVALKMILGGQLASDDDRVRFLREASAIAQMQHPNIVAIHHIGEAPGGVPFFTLEFCAGGSLADRVGQPWPAAEAAALVETLARAVQYAHEHGIVHRDLKPANVL